MKKIFITILSIFSLLLTSPSLVLAAGSTLSLSPATGTFNKNCTFSLQVLLDTGGYDTAGTDVILLYDTTRFIANKVSDGTIYPDYAGNIIDAQTGKVSISGVASAAGGSSFKGSGVLATVDFAVLADAPVGASQIKFDFDPNDKSKTSDTNVVEVGTMVETLNQVTNGNYAVGSGTCGTGGPISTGSATITQTPFGSATPTERVQCKSPDCGVVENTFMLIIGGVALIMFGSISLLKR